MKPALLAAPLLLLPLLLAPGAAAHPPMADPHNACFGLGARQVLQGGVPAVVRSTLSYVGPLACGAGFGSHAPPCPAPPFVGPILGAYCGPVFPPGGTALCGWHPVVNTVPTGLVVGFEWRLPTGGAGFDGVLNFATSGEGPVTQPLPPNVPPPPGQSWAVVNPHPAPGRVIAYPTSMNGVLAPGDLNLVACI